MPLQLATCTQHSSDPSGLRAKGAPGGVRAGAAHPPVVPDLGITPSPWDLVFQNFISDFTSKFRREPRQTDFMLVH